MALATLAPVYLGADADYRLMLKDSHDRVITTYGPSAMLTASCWPGDDQPATFAPTATWIDATSGTIQLHIAGSQTALLEPGQFNLRLIVTAGGVVRSYDLPPLTLLSTAGTGLPLRSYTNLRRILRLVPWIETLESSDPRLVSNFGQEQYEASRWLDAQVMSRAGRILEHQAVRHGPMSVVTPITITTGYDGGTSYGESIYPDLTIKTQLDQIQAYLDTDKLMLDADGAMARRITGYRTVYEVLEDQIGKQGLTTYQDLAAMYRHRANRLLIAWIARIDTDADGVANLELSH